MASVVISAIGDDRSGLVDALAAVIAEHGGNWERSHLTELAGKFAGIVLVTVEDRRVDGLTEALGDIEDEGLLHLRIERARADTESGSSSRFSVTLVGQDHPGIVHEVSHVLATRGVSIDDLQTEIAPAPMGGHLFRAQIVVEAPTGTSSDELQDDLEAVAPDLMVDVDAADDSG